MNLSWLWAIPGLGLAALAYWGLSKFFGWKVGLLAALGIIGGFALKVITAGAFKRGEAANQARQKAKNLELEQRIAAAREAERRRQQETGHVIDPTDPNLRDP